MVKRSDFAVRKLITNSNFVGCSTGKLAYPLENLVAEDSGLGEQSRDVWSVGHQAPRVGACA